MRKGFLHTLVVCCVLGSTVDAVCSNRVQKNALVICSMIITEMTEGRVKPTEAERISLAIANAGNRHFGRVTCGDMWLYMAIVYVESGFRINIVNHKNCSGLFQVHAPSWARKFGLTHKELLEPDANADSGIRVFKYYLGLYQKIVPALSAYNSDHPRAATGYARAVLATRKRIKKRFAELFVAMRDAQLERHSGSPHERKFARTVW
ncbi:MAG: lytic transglycosylase domain-containing protein [Thermodesulfobacteriota bacterium]